MRPCAHVQTSGGVRRALRLSEDHKPHPNVCPAEITRICDAGGCVLWGRVQVCAVGQVAGVLHAKSQLSQFKFLSFVPDSRHSTPWMKCWWICIDECVQCSVLPGLLTCIIILLALVPRRLVCGSMCMHLSSTCSFASVSASKARFRGRLK